MKDWLCTARNSECVFLTFKAVARDFGVPVDTMEIGETFVDKDGDTWERIA